MRKKLRLGESCWWSVIGCAILLITVGGCGAAAKEGASVEQAGDAARDEPVDVAEHSEIEAEFAEDDGGAEEESTDPPEFARLPEPKGAVRLSPDHDVWIDAEEGAVIVDGNISLREGWLEMFACTRGTKEHESIVSVNAQAFLVHTGLLRLGAEPGEPVQFVPEYRPPSGTQIEILVQWIDEDGAEQTERAQDWVQDIRTKEAMKYPFVFAGSMFWVDPETGRNHYMAEGGDFICITNFATAMIDIPVKSLEAEAELMFQAFTERIPPLGAPVRLLLKPKLAEQAVE